MVTMRFVRQVFLRGLVAVLPLAATIYLLIWLASSFESLLGPMLRLLLPEDVYLPGMGVGAGLIAIFLVGLALQGWLGRRIWALGELIVDRTPLVRPIYGAVKQVVSYVGGTEQPQGRTVVTVGFDELPVRLLGLVTREDVTFLSQELEEGLVAVFLPWSYQIGGFTVYVPRSALEPVDLTPQQALRLSLTAGVTTEEPKKESADAAV